MVAQPKIIFLHLSWCENVWVSKEFFKENFHIDCWVCVCFVFVVVFGFFSALKY